MITAAPEVTIVARANEPETAMAETAGITRGRSVGDGRERYDVEIVVPVYNEQADLGPSVRRLHALPRRAHSRSRR